MDYLFHVPIHNKIVILKLNFLLQHSLINFLIFPMFQCQLVCRKNFLKKSKLYKPLHYWSKGYVIDHRLRNFGKLG